MMANPKLRFKEFIEPWETKPLNSVFSLFSGFAFPSSASCDSGVRWLKISDVGIQTMVCSNPSYLPYELKEKYPEFIVNKDEYVIALTRPILNKQLKLAKVGEIYDGALLNQRVAKLISKSSNVDFVYSLLQKSDIIELLANSIAGSDPPNLSLSEIKNINLTIPRIEEQTKIANFLTAVDKKISQLNEQHQLMIQYKKGVMQKIFSQEIRFKDDNGEEFGEWEEKKLGKLCCITTGKLDANAMVENGKYRFYTCAKEFYHIDNFAFDSEALLISGNGANVGYIHYYNGKFNAYQRTYVLEKWTENIIYVKFFLEHFLKERINIGKNEGNTPYIVLSVLTEMPILLPCLNEQAKIADFITKLECKIENLSSQLNLAKEWKKGLLQQMFV
jgi:putative type I restriction enzyme specificity protein